MGPAYDLHPELMYRDPDFNGSVRTKLDHHTPQQARRREVAKRNRKANRRNRH